MVTHHGKGHSLCPKSVEREVCVCVCVCVCVRVYVCVCSGMSDSLQLAHQAPLSMGFSRQEYWSRLTFPPPGDLPNPGIEPTCPKKMFSEKEKLTIGVLFSANVFICEKQ